MFKKVQDALLDQQWASIPIEVYFYWNEDKPKNSGQVHIRSKSKIGFFDGEKVNIFVDRSNVLIVSTGEMRKPNEKAKDTDNWRVLTQGKLKNEDFDFKHRPLFKLLKFQFPVSFKGKKVRASDYIDGCTTNQFAIIVDMH